MKRIKTSRGERGTQLLEFALVVPLMVILALMVGEGALMIRTHIVLNNAAREGARFSSLEEYDCKVKPNPTACMTALQDVVVAYAANNGITLPAANVTVNQNVVIPSTLSGGLTNLPGSQVTVTYNYQMTYLPRFNGAWGNVSLFGQAVFRNEY